MELDGTQVMEIAKKVLIKCSNMEKKKEKTKWAQGKGIFDRVIWFCQSRRDKVRDWVYDR